MTTAVLRRNELDVARRERAEQLYPQLVVRQAKGQLTDDDKRTLATVLDDLGLPLRSEIGSGPSFEKDVTSLRNVAATVLSLAELEARHELSESDDFTARLLAAKKRVEEAKEHLTAAKRYHAELYHAMRTIDQWRNHLGRLKERFPDFFAKDEPAAKPARRK